MSRTLWGYIMLTAHPPFELSKQTNKGKGKNGLTYLMDEPKQ